MGRLIEVDEVKKRYPIMENDFGMVINERLHKELDKISPVEAIPKAEYENRLKADMVAMLTDIQLEIEELKNEPACCHHFVRGIRRSSEVIQQKIDTLGDIK